VLIVAGLQVPVMAGVFVELDGRVGAVEFRQSGPICVNVVVIEGVTIISIVAVVEH
jgi:hypothetical protein